MDVFRILKSLVELDNIRVVKGFQYFELSFEHIELILLELILLNRFNSYKSCRIWKGWGKPYCTEMSVTQDLFAELVDRANVLYW